MEYRYNTQKYPAKPPAGLERNCDGDGWETDSASDRGSGSIAAFSVDADSTSSDQVPKIPACGGNHATHEFYFNMREVDSLFADDFSFSCDQCMSTLPQNPHLCKGCSRWNVAETTFKPSFDDVDGNFVVCRPLQEYLLNERCMFCTLLGQAVLEKLGGTPQHDSTLHEVVNVVNCGPYWGFDCVEPQSESFPLHNLSRQGFEGHCIFLLVVSGHADDFWHDQEERPDLAERAFSDQWRNSSISVPVKLKYQPPGIGLLEVSRCDARFFDIVALQRILSNSPSECSSETQSDDEFFLSESNEQDLTWRNTEQMLDPLSGQPLQHVNSWSTEDSMEMVQVNQDKDRSTFLARKIKLRLIDTEALCVIQTEIHQDLDFAALSYLWASSDGQSNFDLMKASEKLLKVPGVLKKDNQPHVIWDAIQLCQDLEIRFLWTDRLCITQDDADDLATQIAQMDQIYGQASITIADIVDHTYDVGLPGVRGRPRRSSIFDRSYRFQERSPLIRNNMAEAIDQSVWNTRGWTFQERMMSQCLLCISNFQWYIVGRTDHQESFGYVGDYHAADDMGRKSIRWPDLEISQHDYTRLVEHYTRRNLTHGKDILAAFAAVANVMSHQSQAEHLFGLFADHLDEYLLWGYAGSAGRRKDKDLSVPSWSWAAWDGSAWYHSIFEDFYQDSVQIGKLVTYYIVRQSGVLSKLNIKETWFRHYDGIDVPETLENGYLGYGQMRYRSKSPDKDWRGCPHNPWTMLKHQAPDSITTEIASHHPNALVFHTTVASLRLSAIEENLALEDYEGKPSGMRFPSGIIYILGNDGRRIGHLMRLDPTWARTWHNTEQKYDLVVLSAGTFPEPVMNEPRTAAAPLRRLFDKTVKMSDYSNFWTLNVMLVERDSWCPAVCRRIAIGIVLMRFWRECEPRWETVVLT